MQKQINKTPKLLPSLKSMLFWPRSLCNKGKPSIVFDLDNTLVYSTELPTPGTTFECFVKGKKYYVHVRPGTHQFLQTLKEHYNIYFFTAASKEYAQIIIKKIAPFVSLKNCFYRESCIFKWGYAIKDLNILKQPLNKVILIDDVLGSGAMQPINTICIQPWEGQASDRVLSTELLPLLLNCAEEEDIPKALHTKLENSQPKHLAFYSGSK